MKKAMRNYGFIAIALVALTFAFSNTALANEEGPTKNVTELKFIGNKENQPVFELNLISSVEDEYTITFRDEYGNTCLLVSGLLNMHVVIAAYDVRLGRK